MSVTTYAAAQFLRLLPRAALSRAVGMLAEAQAPRAVLEPVLATYTRAYRVALEEAEPEGQPYSSFDAFFTRRLRPGMRPIEGGAETFVSPADGRLSEMGRVDRQGVFLVKGQRYTLGELLADDELAHAYEGGAFGIVYLSPRDYHRVHSPVSGTLTHVRAIAGDRYPVNRIGELHIPRLFSRNRRVLAEIDSPVFGRVLVILVGAMIVGRMTIVGVDQPDVAGTHQLNRQIARGEELGAFHLGSTAVFVLPPARPALAHSQVGTGFAGFSRSTGDVLYGQSVAFANGATDGADEANAANNARTNRSSEGM